MLLITPTSGRPAALKQLVKYITAQTFDWKKWIIVADDWEGYNFPKDKKIQIVKRDPSEDTLGSLRDNLLAALDQVGDHDRFAIVEDDDWYHREYLYELNKLLDKADLAGFNEDAYYYVFSRRACRWHNQDKASFAATAFKASVVPFLKEIALTLPPGDDFLDVALWQKWKGSKILAHNFTGLLPGMQPKIINDRTNPRSGDIADEHPRHVGLKEPWHGGRSGLSTFGHTAAGGFDQRGLTLKKWLGDDADFYLAFTRAPDLTKPPPGVMVHMEMQRVEG